MPKDPGPAKSNTATKTSQSRRLRAPSDTASPPDKAPASPPSSRAGSVPGLGPRLRGQRIAARISLRQLARTLDVSASFVSQIETGKSQPSVATLYQICQVLNISVDELFDAAASGSASGFTAKRPEAPGVPSSVAPLNGSQAPALAVPPPADSHSPVVSPDQRLRLVLDSGVTWEKLSVSGEAAVDFMLVRYEVGSSSTPDGLVTRHTGMEYGYVLSGTLDVTLGFDSYTVGPAQSISFDSSTPHRLANNGRIPVEAIWFVHGRRANHEH